MFDICVRYYVKINQINVCRACMFVNHHVDYMATSMLTDKTK